MSLHSVSFVMTHVVIYHFLLFYRRYALECAAEVKEIKKLNTNDNFILEVTGERFFTEKFFVLNFYNFVIVKVFKE